MFEIFNKLGSIGVTKLVEMILRTVTYFIDKVVYGFIIKLYNLFRLLCEARISDSKILGELATRVGLILGLVMFFYVTFDFVQILIDPDKLVDKEKGPLNIIKKFLIVIVLFGTSKFMFDSFNKVQSIVLSPGDEGTSVIERLILPYKMESSSFGTALSANFMKNFYQITSDEEARSAEPLEGKSGTNYDACESAASALPRDIATYGSLNVGDYCLNGMYKGSDGSYKFYIDYNPLSCLVGIFVLWMLLMYCISVGMRAIQLGFLEIISPVAFIAYLSPKKDSMFSKFWKIYFATYIDVFIRIAIINFVVLLSGLILNIDDYGFWASVGNPSDGNTRFWLSLFMILALLSFAKKAPELIKQFLPDKIASGLSFGLGTKDRAGLGMLGGTLAGATTGLLGGIVAGVTGSEGNIFKRLAVGAVGGVGGITGGTVRGGVAGVKGKNLREAMSNASKSQKTVNSNFGQRLAAGGSALPIPLPISKLIAGHYDSQKEKLESHNDYAKSVFGHIDAMKERAISQIDKGKFKSDSVAKRNAAKLAIESIQEQARNMRETDFDSYAMKKAGITDLKSASSDQMNEFNRLRSAAYDEKQKELASQMQEYQGIFNAAEDAAVSEFFAEKKGGDAPDAVISQHLAELEAEIKYGPSDVTFAGNFDTWKGLDNMGNSAKSFVSKNVEDLSRNKDRGRRSRADVKFREKK